MSAGQELCIYTQRILHQRITPQGNSTILPSEVANLPTETGPEGSSHPPLAPGLVKVDMRWYFHCQLHRGEIVKINIKV